MKAVPYFRLKSTDENGSLTEAVVWKVPESALYPQGVRYRLAFIPKGHDRPAVLYDNHHPKGHHKHLENREFPYLFISVHQLRLDFEKDVKAWKEARG